MTMLVFIYITSAIVLYLFMRSAIIMRASRMYEGWSVYDLREQARLRGIIRQANKRRKKVERLLARERRRTDVWVRQPRYGKMAEQIRQLEARNRELAATVIESILDEQPVADVLVDRLRTRKP